MCVCKINVIKMSAAAAVMNNTVTAKHCYYRSRTHTQTDRHSCYSVRRVIMSTMSMMTTKILRKCQMRKCSARVYPPPPRVLIFNRCRRGWFVMITPAGRGVHCFTFVLRYATIARLIIYYVIIVLLF